MQRKTQTFGYVRVSTREQNEVRQLVALEPFRILKRNLYIDKQSGKDFERPAYQKLLRRLKKGDVLIVKSIDRLGRDYAEIIEQWRVITKEKCADIKILDMPLLDTTYAKDVLGTFIADLVLAVLSYSAQLERDSISQRQSEGIAAAKARGVQFGRQEQELPADFERLYAQWKGGEISASKLAEQCGFTRRTLYRRMKLLNLPNAGMAK